MHLSIADPKHTETPILVTQNKDHHHSVAYKQLQNKKNQDLQNF